MTKYIVIFLFITTQHLIAQSGECYFNRLDTRSGLSNNAVTAIYQDDVGAIWLGLYGGLNRYNGQSIENFPLSQDSTGLTQNVIHKIIGNKNKQIYIRALRDILMFDLKTEQFKTIYRNNAEDIFLTTSQLYILTTTNKVEVVNLNSLQKEHSFDLSPDSPSPTRIWINKRGCWIGSENGLSFYSSLQSSGHKTIIPKINVRSFYEDRKGNLWVGSNSDGVFRIAPNDSIDCFQHKRNTPSLIHNEVRDIVEDNYGNLYFGTFFGMSRYNPIRNEWHNYTSIDGVNHSLSHSSIYSLYRDNQGSIWIGTWFGGVNHFNPSADIFKFYGVKNGNNRFLSFPFVSKIAEDKNGNLWIGTEGGGLNYLNRKTNRFTHFVHQEGKPQTIAGNNIKSIYYEPNSNKLYIGTHASGLSILDANTLQFRNFAHNPSDPESIPSNIINHIYPYKQQLILLTQKGIVLFNPQTYRCSPFPIKKETADLAKPFVFETLLIDSANRLWVSKTNGGLLRIDLTSGSFTEYYNNPTDSNSIGKYRVVSIIETKQKQLFFGTVGSGLFEYLPHSNNFKAYTQASGDLSGDICYAIGESSYEHLFVLHDKGVSLLKRNNDNLVSNYSLRFPNANFFLGSSIFFTQDDETFIGSSEGLFRFYEPQLYTTYNDYKLYFDKLTVNNSSVRPQDKTEILDQALALTPRIKLNHDQNNFSVSFATSNYIANTNYLFEYMLEGFDKQWIAAPVNGVIVYTNINPGSYRLIVRSTQSSDPNPHEIALNIRINPPFYASIGGYLLYVLAIGYALYRWVRFNRSQAMLKASLEMERREKEQIEALNQMKLRFFTNISHEFRTPLSLIIAQIEILLSSDNLTASTYNRVLKINNHANNLKRLITELLDFRKIDQGFIKLHVTEADLTAFLNEIGTAFYEYAQSRSIDFEIRFDQPSTRIWFDPLQLSKVFNNLLSNAFKYTPIGGQISLSIEEQEQQVIVTVSNSGQGISVEALKHIFERFYQVDDLPVSGLSSGTGIGLALSKNIIDLHHGSISVESSEGQGCTFVVALSKDPSRFTDEERTPLPNSTTEPIVPYLDEIPQWTVSDETPRQEESPIALGSDRPSILIVEDNPELLQTLEELFAKDYEVHTAQDGEEGLQKTRNLFPDLILSDVIMPRMSGKEMCHRIKQDFELSHIPLILLTANNSLEQAIEGYEFGADDYITKPFNIKMLIVRCSNLIRSRQQLLQRLALPTPSPSKKGKKATEDPDQRFIDEVCLLIKEHLNDHNFDIDYLAHQLKMGRTKLYSRIKKITGITPNEMVLQLKLEESARLLIDEPGLTISEISYQVGFTSPKYFTKCFKSVYSIVPLEYRKQMRTEE